MSHPGPNLVPAPRRYESLAGSLDISRGFEIRATPSLREQAGLVATWLGASLPCLVRLADEASARSPSAPSPSAGSPPDSAAPGPARDMARLELSLDASFAGREEYRLEVSAVQVSVVASSTEGLVRGASTLWQLVLSATSATAHGRAGAHLEACVIKDGPRFAWRGFMLDTARNFFPVDFIERLLDLAALHKLNIFHWHLSDDQAWRLDLPSLPELAREGSRRLDRRYNVEVWKTGAYSPQDVKRIVAFASLRGITVVPEIESPGHVTALLASHPELSCAAKESLPAFLPEDRYGIFEDILCAGNEAGFALLESVIDDLAGLFPGPFVHMGGDEAPKARWLACPRCRLRMEELGFVGPDGSLEPERLQAWFMARVAAILARHGKRLVGWDEIIDSHGSGGEGLPADAIIMSWRGYAGGLAGARLGHDVVMCPQTKACYLDHKHLDLPGEPGQLGVCTVRDAYGFEALPPGLGAEEEGRILGGQANIWSELMYFGRQVEYMAFPRLSALSEALWSPKEGRDFEDFAKRLPAHLGRLDALGVDYYRGPLC